MRDFEVVLSDLFEIVRRKRGKILFCTALFAIIALSWAATRDINYVSEGTFRDKGNAEAGVRHTMSDLIFGMGHDRNDSESISVMKSARILEALIKQNGLQGAVSEKLAAWPRLDKIKNNFIVEWAYLTSKRTPVLEDPFESLVIKEVEYPGEREKIFEITFLDEERFQTSDGRTGRLSVPYKNEDYQITFKRSDGRPLAGRSFWVSLNPLKNTSKDLSLLLNVKIDFDDHSLVRLSYLSPDRHKGAHFINTLMRAYQGHLEEEHDRIAVLQLDYLEKREKDIALSFQKIIEEYAENSGQDLSISGFTDSQKEVEFLSGQLVQASQKLMEIALDEKRLDKVLKRDFVSFDPSRPGTADGAIINELLQKMRDLKLGLDSLDIALLDEEVVASKHEFQGITLQTAKELYAALSHDRQENETTLRQLDFVVKQMDSPEFEITSLTAVLTDPISVEKIQKASNTSLAMKDAGNRTTRELDRLREELGVQKEFLSSHLVETAKLLQLKGEVLDEKNRHLQQVMRDLTKIEIGLFHKQLSDYITVRLQNLEHEKNLIDQRQSGIKNRLAEIPQQWIKEQLLNQHLSRNQKMVENITGMVESKNISNNLELIQSAPLDWATPPMLPKNPRLLMFSVAGALFGGLFSSLFFVATGLLRGVPLTQENLSLNGFKTLGTLTYKKNGKELPLLESNFDTLRRALAYLPENHLALINFSGAGLDYSDLLAELLRKKGETVLRLHLDFKSAAKEIGLKQYLERACSLQSIIHEDTIKSGGYEPFESELLSQPRFKELLSELKSRYSWVVASSPAPLASATTECLIGLFDAALIGLAQETLDELKPLLEKLKTNKRAAFLKFKC